MPRHIRGGQSTYTVGPTYTFAPNPDEEQAQAGAASWRDTFQHALATEQHRISQEYERLHYELTVAKWNHELQADEAKAHRQMKFETMMAEAVPKLYEIDPASKDAQKQAAEIIKEYPQLGGHQPFLQHVDHIEGAIRGARELDKKADDMAGRQTEHETFQTQLAAQRSSDISDRQKEREAFQTELRKAKAPSAAIQTRYQKAVNDAANYQKELDQTQKFIDEQEAKGDKIDDVSQKNLTNMLKSRDAWRGRLDKETATKDALELVHPELSPDFKPDDATSDSTAKPAPVARGTATPSGDMDTSGSTNGTASPEATPKAPAPPVSKDNSASSDDAGALNNPPPKSGDTVLDGLTKDMHDSDMNAESARKRRDAALETLRTAKLIDFANPFSSKIDDAKKEFERAGDLVDQHEAAYMDALHKRGELISNRVGGDSTAAAETPAPEAPVAESAPVNPVIAPDAGAQVTPAETGAAAPPVAAAPHPLEGKRVLQKSTGKYGTFTDGQFVPES